MRALEEARAEKQLEKLVSQLNAITKRRDVKEILKDIEKSLSNVNEPMNHRRRRSWNQGNKQVA